MKNIYWCTNCLNMSTRPRITFNEKGLCNACQWMQEKKNLNWDLRQKTLLNLLEGIKKNKKGNYDCLVPVSGGKDGTYVAYQLRDKHKLNVLTATTRPPIELEVGKENLKNFISKGFDHVHLTTNSNAMRKMNKIGFIKKGSPYYGWLVSVFTSMIRLAISNNIELIFYGEDGEVEYGGSSKNKNNPFFDLKFMVNNYFEGEHKEICTATNLSREELFWFTVDEKETIDKNLKLTHWGFFEPWDSYRNYLFSKEKYKFSESKKSNVGTFTNFAQNDQAIFALHTYLMYLKFGFGRATQDAGIEIRRGAMTRDQALNLVKLYDNSYPGEYLDLYLDYYEMTKKEFDVVLDSHVNKDLFRKENGIWVPTFQIK